jgi:hypothetical protein
MAPFRRIPAVSLVGVIAISIADTDRRASILAGQPSLFSGSVSRRTA